ncbi:hypothetical protein ACDN41_12200 [Priestia aryabhattai]|uniref:hypothetical protein n=1 Tax=Priestia aryabhattai TaxID=412384 RepID=UPI0035323318
MSYPPKCKSCGAEMDAEFVDIGIGTQQVTDWECPNECGYLEWQYEQDMKVANVKISFDEWLKNGVNSNE